MEARRRLRTLLFAVAAGAIVPLVLGGLVAIHTLSQTERERSSKQLQARSDAVAAAIAREIGRMTQLGETLASSRYIGQGDFSTFEAVSRDAGTRVGMTVTLIDRSHRQVLSTTPVAAATLSTTEAAAVDDVFRNGAARLAEAIPTRNAKGIDIVVLVPVEPAGSAEFVIAVRSSEKAILRILREQALPPDWRSAILDGDNVIVARTVDHQQFLGKASVAFQKITARDGFRETVDLQGIDSLTAWSAVESTDWRAIVWAPKSSVYADSNAVVFWGSLLLLLAVAAAIAIAAGMSRSIERPMHRLMTSADRIGSGEAEFCATGVVEVDAVGKALVAAAARVQDREADLLRSVAHVNDLMRELSHRIKNLMAVVTAVARQTARSSRSLAAFQPAFEQRLAGLSHSIELLTGTEWRGAHLRELIDNQLRAFAQPGQLSLTGPDVVLRPEAVQNIGMALHELATNAAKHGALSFPTGKVAVAWSAAEDDFTLSWTERDGPMVVPSQHCGFGKIVIERMVGQALDGRSNLTLEPAGAVWTFSAPLARVVETVPGTMNDNQPTTHAQTRSDMAV